MRITSVENSKVVYWAKLKMKKYRDIEHTFIVEGDNLVEEALKKGIVKEIITLEDNKKYNVPVYEVTEEILKRLSTLVSPSGIMAVCDYILPDDIIGNVLILDGIQDPGNFGTIIRSAVAFNFKTIITSLDTVDMYNDKVIRSSEGMIFNINILRSDLESMIPYLSKNGYKIYGTSVINGTNITEIKKERLALVIGNEGKGIRENICELCDDFVYINMSKNCESLNAAVASSILMYEVSK